MRRLPVALALVAACAACGNSTANTADLGPPARVAEELVPPTLAGEQLSVRLYAGEDAKEAFAGADEKALVADGKLWEIRRGETLVGVLQISTVKRSVRLEREDHRKAILSSILPGGTKRLTIEAVTVSFAETEDQIRYVWFGADFYEVLTLKTSRVRPQNVVGELVAFQVDRPEWRPLPQTEES